VISLGGIVYSASVRVGGDKFDEAIINYIRRNYGMLIGETTAERSRRRSAPPSRAAEVREKEVKGRNLAEGIPRSFTISQRDPRGPRRSAQLHRQAVKSALEQTPPELGADIAEPRHGAHRWRRAAARSRPPPHGRDRPAGDRRRGPPDLRRARLRQGARVDKGALQGVVAGRPVVDEAGLVGQVTRVFPTSSEITLLVSREQSAPVLNLRNGLRLMVSGLGTDDLLEVRYLDTQADLKAGDILATSGIDGVYPAGIPVARVLRLELPRHTPFARAVCAPLAGVGRHRHILILQAMTPPTPPITPPATTTP
jgi:hypothetical protein